MCVVVGIAGAGLAAGVGTAVAGSEAAGATESATNAAINQQNSALSQTAALSQPYRDLGTAAIPSYEKLLGLDPSAGPGTIQQALENTPGYQFTKSQGDTAALNASSTAGGVSGNTIAALEQYDTGLASQTYQQNVTDIGNAVGTGQAAAAGQAQNVTGAAGNISSALINQGNTTAGIDANTIAGITKSFGSGLDNYTTLSALKALNTQVPAAAAADPALAAG